MSTTKQIFQTNSRLRRYTFRWTGRAILALVLACGVMVWLAITNGYKPFLPGLTANDYKKVPHPVQPKGLSPAEDRRYRGFADYLSSPRNCRKQSLKTSRIRAAFYVDWDPQAFYSLQSHIDAINMVMPEWFFIDPVADTLVTSIDMDALRLMKSRPGLRILPILSNVNTTGRNGDFDGRLLSTVMMDPVKRQKLLKSVIARIDQYGFQGINIDFEDPEEKALPAIHGFQQDLFKKLHASSRIITQDIMADDEDFRPAELDKVNDYLFLMAYDQHYATSVPGAVSDQRWIEKQLDEVAHEIPSGHVVLCLAGYGYDWPAGGEAHTLTYQQALSEAKEFKADVDYDNDSYNCSFSYTGNDSIRHQVSFLDAAGSFNTMRFADEYGTAGVALWRLGAEDERLWRFYGRDLSNEALQKEPFDYHLLASIDITSEKPDYIGEGEVLDVVNEPEKGVIDISADAGEQVISEEKYRQLPSRYVIRRFGKVHNEVMLTFDDGPDARYTPQILDILQKEKVPAAFFVVGMNAEKNLPLLKEIYRQGYEIGNHSFTHPNMAAVSTRRAEAETEATRLLLEAATGRSTILFRAPYNADAEPTRAVELKPVARGKENSYYTVGESIDPEDWDVENGVNADSIYQRVVRQYEKDPSRGIILLHDAGGNRQATVDALPSIIHYFKNKGVRFTSVSHLLGLNKDAIMPPVHNELVKMNEGITVSVYWAERLVYAAFWLAIAAGLGRILLMALLALLQYRRSRNIIPVALTALPKVSIIVPAYNEEVNAVNTVRNLLRQDYPEMEIIFVDDGSRDATYEVVKAAFDGHPRVRVVTKPNGGKASALNLGISLADSEFVVCIDADTQLHKDAVRRMMQCFTDENTAAVAGNVKVGNEKNILTRWQSIEYITAQNFDRRAFDYVNGITVVPGAIGAFRKNALLEAGGFATDTLAEDCDLTIRLLRAGYRVRNCTEAVAVTEAPETLRQFMKQRFRWCYGIMQSFWKNRDACFNPRYGALGMIALPNILLFQILMPLVAPLADLLFFFSIAWNWHDAASLHQILFYYGLFLLVDLGVSLMAFRFEKQRPWKLVWLLPQRFAYRQLMYVILFRAIGRAIRGESQGWGVLKRTGNVKLEEQKPVVVAMVTNKQNGL